jgi:hypothetical protein
MCRERSEGSGSSGRAAIQSRANEGRRWWQYGGGITLDNLVEHQEHTSVGRIAQRRSKKPAKELRRSGAYDRQYGRCQGTIPMDITLQKRQRNTGVIRLHVVENVRKECGLHTEPRALRRGSVRSRRRCGWRRQPGGSPNWSAWGERKCVFLIRVFRPL